MTMINRFACALTLAAGAASSACDSLGTQEYAGEPLFVLNGVVSSRIEAQPEDLKIGLVFTGPSEDGDLLLAHVPAEVEGEFPARFTLRLLEPPPAEMIDASGSTSGTIVVAPSLPDGVIAVPPQADLLALADELGWVDVAPVGVTYLPEDASSNRDGDLQPGFNAWTYDVDAEIAAIEHDECAAAAAETLTQCRSACGNEDSPDFDEDAYASCAAACTTTACGTRPESTFRYLEAGEEVSFELGHSLLARSRAERDANN
jgi:hypothetical protein